MNNKVVYLHKDSNDIIRYVGSGTVSRANNNSANSHRGKAYADFTNTYGKFQVEIIVDGLNKSEAESLEREIYDKYIDTILNHNRPSSERTMTKEMFDGYLYYDETSKSCLRWKVDIKYSKIKANSEAGSLNNLTGYFQIKVNNKLYQSHRIIALLHNLNIKGMIIDHIDRNKSNNKISNLRVTTQQENCNNKSLASNNTSATQGVSFNKLQNSWIASWSENRKRKCKYFPITNYESSEEAKQAAIYFRKQMEELYYNRE